MIDLLPIHRILSVVWIALHLLSCGGSGSDEPIRTNIRSYYSNIPESGFYIDSLPLQTRPGNVLLTFHHDHRLVPIYMVNQNARTNLPYTGTNQTHPPIDITYASEIENNWHGNFLPGYTAVHGFNMVNVIHYRSDTSMPSSLFDSPVLIQTIYHPAYSQDTLNGSPVRRNHYLVSAYDEDTNKDGFINRQDLRRFFAFDLDGKQRTAIVPPEYSVMSAEYDPANDHMLIVTRQDNNSDGEMEYGEATVIFGLDLDGPGSATILFGN